MKYKAIFPTRVLAFVATYDCKASSVGGRSAGLTGVAVATTDRKGRKAFSFTVYTASI